MIVLKNISLQRGTKTLLDQAYLNLQRGERIGLIGRNGVGKSSLLALLTGQLHEDAGDVFLPPDWIIAQVQQHLPMSHDPASDYVQAGDARLVLARQQVQTATDGTQLAHALAYLDEVGEHDAAARANTLLMGLGFAPHEIMQPVDQFSGGWQMRLQLARALMAPSDVLLLDEPTNHLDLDALVWLEQWLNRYEGLLIIISHDRMFLDATTTVTIELAQGQLTRYGGNYTTYETLRSEQLALQTSAWQKQQQHRAHLQHFIDRFKAKATKARQAQSRIKALERLETIAPVLAEREWQFEFKPITQPLPNPLLRLTDVQVGYPTEPQPTVILRHVNATVLAGGRIGILGANGQGKSTLVKTLAGTLHVVSGQITWGKGVRVGYFAQQELDVLQAQDSPLDHMRNLAQNHITPSREQDWRNHLGQFLFSGDMVHQPVGTLSGGEKARLVLAMLVWQEPQLLLLDEPTNHLDLITRETLCMALNGFEGAVVLVSHDRALLGSVCDDFWLISDGHLKPFEGDLQDYQRWILDHAKQKRQATKLPPTPHPTSASLPSSSLNASQQRKDRAAHRAKLAPLTKAIQTTERQMAQLNEEKTTLEADLLVPQDSMNLARLGKRLKAIETELTTLEETWLELSMTLEAENG